MAPERRVFTHKDYCQLMDLVDKYGSRKAYIAKHYFPDHTPYFLGELVKQWEKASKRLGVDLRAVDPETMLISYDGDRKGVRLSGPDGYYDPNGVPMMTLVLVLGDIHIPQRAADIPAKFRKLLVPGKIDQILCTGNLTDRATYEYLRSITPDLYITRGEFDDRGQNYPISARVQQQELTIGLVSGHYMVPSNGDVDGLAGVARQMDVDVLVTGNTHRFEAYEEQGRFFINPGSITGGWGALEMNPVPSFVLMEVKGRQLVVYVYQLVNDEVVVDRIEYRKNEE
ncbi:Vacuolar protein sorting-associated protein 29 [Coemansia sp. RSA 486]|nr:Vacuolar protein sorting-associated protein 29 [Coemansia sp. RSA 486]